MTRKASNAPRPPIILCETEADLLSGLADGVEDRLPHIAEMLISEIGRAQIVADDAMPDDVIRMGSTVTFIDDRTGQNRTVQLVFPQQADIAANRISILTPIGAGLIGLRPGQAIDWPDRDGQTRLLRVVDVAHTDVLP